MAGIWQPTAKDNQFTILTTSPNASVLPVHDRMPLVLIPEEVMPWIQDFGAAEKLLTKIPPLLEHKQEYEQLSLFTNSAGVSGGCDHDMDSEGIRAVRMQIMKLTENLDFKGNKTALHRISIPKIVLFLF